MGLQVVLLIVLQGEGLLLILVLPFTVA